MKNLNIIPISFLHYLLLTHSVCGSSFGRTIVKLYKLPSFFPYLSHREMPVVERKSIKYSLQKMFPYGEMIASDLDLPKEM